MGYNQNYSGGGGGAASGIAYDTSVTGHVDSTANLEFLFQLNGDYTDQSTNAYTLTAVEADYRGLLVDGTDETTLNDWFSVASTEAVASGYYTGTSPGIPILGTGTGSMTLAALVRRDTTAGDYYAVSYGSGAADNIWALGANGDDPRVTLSTATRTTSTGAELTSMLTDTGVWHHICAVITDQTTTVDVDVYHNGISVATSTGAAVPSVATPRLFIGTAATAGNLKTWSGNIRSVIGINDALDATAVLALATAALA